jgi:hypothetical protein
MGGKMDARDVRQEFGECVRLPDGQLDLAEAALLIAEEEYPALDRLKYLEVLDELADAAARGWAARTTTTLGSTCSASTCSTRRSSAARARLLTRATAS